MSWKSRKAKTKTRRIKAKDLRKAGYAAEREEAGLAQTPPAKKVGDQFPVKPVILLCKLCAYKGGCEIESPTISSCSDFTRKLGKQATETIQAPPKGADLSHLVANQKLESLHKQHVWLIKEWETAKKTVSRIEMELNRVEAEIRRNSPKVICPAHLPAHEFFRNNHEKAEVKADPWKPAPAKAVKVKKASNPAKTAKVDLSKIDLDSADF